MNQDNPVAQSKDPLLAQTLAASEDFIETFRYSDWQPRKRHSLINSCKITEILQYINALYTVYTNLYVYNKKGEVLAVSNPKARGIVDCFAVFADRRKTIIAVANQTDLKIGEPLVIADRFFTMKNGQRRSEIVQFNGALD